MFDCIFDKLFKPRPKVYLDKPYFDAWAENLKNARRMDEEYCLRMNMTPEETVQYVHEGQMMGHNIMNDVAKGIFK